MTRERRMRRAMLAAAGLGMLAAFSCRAPALRATDTKQSYADRVLPARPRPAPAPRPRTPEERAALTALLREDLASWNVEVFGPLAFTNRTCVRLRARFLVRQGRAPMREDMMQLQRTVLSVRQGMLDRARGFVARTENVRELNRLLCEVLRLHVAWMTRITEREFDLADCPAPQELVEAKRAFTSAFAPCRPLVGGAPGPED